MYSRGLWIPIFIPWGSLTLADATWSPRPPELGDSLVSLGARPINHYTDYVRAVREISDQLKRPVEAVWESAADGSRYRVENVALTWDPAFGPEMSGSQAAFKNFAFPFSGKTWNSASVGMTGSMTFGEQQQPVLNARAAA